jgi:AhpD family alkylhydroperoxidase
MANPLLSVPWEQCLLPARRDAELERFVRQQTGVASPLTRYLTACPWLVRGLARLSYERGLLVHLDLDLADLIALVVSQEHACRFCYAVSRALLRLRGMSESRVEALEGRLSRMELEPRQRAAVAFARRMSRSAPLVGEEDRRRLAAAGFGPEERREIAFVVGYIAFANRVATIPAIPPYGVEKMPDRWMMRLLRPMIARVLAAHMSRGTAAALPAVPVQPHADLIRAFAGSPIAARLGACLDEAWASPLLSRRCKALLFAVVAQALGCTRSASAIAPVLGAEGFPPEELARLLASLDSPQLTQAERALLGFARETVWYQPGAIQRRARALHEQLGTEPFVEALGVLSLANALCRLTAAVAQDA